MPNEFRFFLLCHGVESEQNVPGAVLRGVINSVVQIDSEPTPLFAVVGAVIVPAMKQKSLDMMVWRLDRSGQRQTLPGFVGMPLILPNALGPQVMPYQFALPTPTPGIYGAELFDRDGTFGKRQALLATFMFGVN
jgi:hypothetical protein